MSNAHAEQWKKLSKKLKHLKHIVKLWNGATENCLELSVQNVSKTSGY